MIGRWVGLGIGARTVGVLPRIDQEAPMSLRTRALPAIAGAVVLAFVSLLAAPAGAIGTLDQSQPLADSSVTVYPGLLQTFTVGRTGRLDGVQITSPGGGPAVVQIYRIGATLPGTPLLSSNLTVSLMPGQAATIGLPSIPVQQGDVLGIAVGAVRSTSGVDLAQATGSVSYPGGVLYRVVGASSFTPLDADLQFATFVTDPAPTQLDVATLRSTKGRPTATLTSAGTGVVGKSVSFTLRRVDGSVVSTCVATTTATGTATCAVKWSMPRNGHMDVAFGGDVDYLSSTGSTTS